MTVKKFEQTDAKMQTLHVHADQTDANFSVLTRLGDAFAPRAQDHEDMTLALDAGAIFEDSNVLEISMQNTPVFVAPVANPRIDRVVVDQDTGILSVVAGNESATSVLPEIPLGKIPVAQVHLEEMSIVITNEMIIDERVGGGAYSIPLTGVMFRSYTGFNEIRRVLCRLWLIACLHIARV